MNAASGDLVLFDLDGTLLAGDSDFEWGVFLCDRGAVEKDEYQRRNKAFYSDYQAGRLDVRAYLDFALAPLGKIPPQRLAALREEFMMKIIEPIIKPAALDLVAEHQCAGDLTVIITSTNRFITEPIAERFGVEHLIATEPERKDGRYTGKLAGTPCYQEGKLEHLRRWRERERPAYRKSRGYSDSYNDLALLSWVDTPIVVDGDPRLVAHAEANDWQVTSLKG